MKTSRILLFRGISSIKYNLYNLIKFAKLENIMCFDSYNEYARSEYSKTRNDALDVPNVILISVDSVPYSFMKKYYNQRKDVSIINFSNEKNEQNEQDFDSNKYIAEFRQYINKLEKKLISKIVEPEYVYNFTNERFLEFKRHEDYIQEMIKSNELMNDLENVYR